MGEYGKRAEQLFMEGYNCSQAVLLSYSDITGLDDKTAAMLASGFGGGMGRGTPRDGQFNKVFPIVSVNPRRSTAAGADLRSKYADVPMAAPIPKC